MGGNSGGHPGVVRLGGEAVPDIVEVFAEAFRDYPVMRFVLGTEGDYEARLPTLIRFFVSARALRDEPLLGVAGDGNLAAAATVSFPWDSRPVPDLDAVREATWGALGPDARARYEACGAVWKDFTAPEPHIHLNMIGVRPTAQGQGLARRLLDHVHLMSGGVPGSLGVTLTTEDPRNVAFYQRAGYEITGHARLAPRIETWGFFRRTSGRPGAEGSIPG